MAFSVTEKPLAWGDHHHLQSAAAAHRRTIAKQEQSDTEQLCTALAGAALAEPFSLDTSPAQGPTDVSHQGTTKPRVASIFKRPS